MRELKGKSLIEIPNKYIAFDIETTGLDSMYDEIIEIGAIKIEDGKEIETFSTLIKPEYEIDEFITELTGITNEMVIDAPKINEVLPKFMDFINDSVILGHNVNFDINFIYDNLINEDMKPITNDFVDTLRLSRRLLPELKHHRLSDLANYYNIDTTGSHRSLTDVRITIDIFKNLEKLVESKYSNIENFKDACKKKSHSCFKASDITTINTEFDEDNLLYDKYFAITGTLERMSRKEAMQIIADLGGHCQDSVNKDTNFLILGNNDYNPILRGKKSSKLLKAESLKLKGQDIEILSENVFYDVIPELENKTIQKQDNFVGIPINNGSFNEKEKQAYYLTKDILARNGKNIEDIRCNINSSNYFDISLMYPILRLKLRGNKDYIVIDKYADDSYDFSYFLQEPCTKNDNGKCRLILSNIEEVEKLEKYIVDQYECALAGNKTYIGNVKVGQTNYNKYLKENYQ